MHDVLDLFAYGSLQPGGRYWSRIRTLVEVVGGATTSGRLVATPMGWPAATFEGDGVVHGTLLRPRTLDDAGPLYRIADQIEGEGRLFRRVVVQVQTGGGSGRAAAYEWHPRQGPPPGEVVADGRWRLTPSRVQADPRGGGNGGAL